MLFSQGSAPVGWTQDSWSSGGGYALSEVGSTNHHLGTGSGSVNLYSAIGAGCQMYSDPISIYTGREYTVSIGENFK